jgi:hypothetical protein
MVSELFSDLSDFFLGWRPVRFARIAVKQQIARFQVGFEFVAGEGDGQIVIVRTDGIELCNFVHSNLA